LTGFERENKVFNIRRVSGRTLNLVVVEFGVRLRAGCC